jgi:hypothetical protein
MLAGAHGLAPVGSIDANISFGLPAATHSVGECSLLIAHQGEGRTAVAGIGVEQPHRSCPQRPPLAGRRASTDDCIRLQAAGRPVTASATTRSPAEPSSSPDAGPGPDRPRLTGCLCRVASPRPTSKAPRVSAEGSSHAIGMSPLRWREPWRRNSKSGRRRGRRRAIAFRAKQSRGDGGPA